MTAILVPGLAIVIVCPYRGETERVDLYSEGRDVFLLEFASDVTLDEGGLDMAISIHDATLNWGRKLPFRYHRHRQAQA